jgi:hypothetical protein
MEIIVEAERVANAALIRPRLGAYQVSDLPD